MPDTKMSGNKGEWSELYAFFKLLAQGRVYSADDHAERIDNIYYPVLKIIREEHPGDVIDYVIRDESVEIISDAGLLISVSRQEVDRISRVLFYEILCHDGSFELEDIKNYANNIQIKKIKAPSSDTTDILLQMRDVHTGFVTETGFSIKSEVGHPPTLINASGATNFVYKIENITKAQAEEINAINTRSKIRDRLNRIFELGGTINFCKPDHNVMRRNLIMVDGDMPKIIAEMLLYSYTKDIRECSELINLLGERDPLDYGETIMYSSKFKRFLHDSALGMKPATPWDGTDEANGGCIIVKENGEILAYTVYNRNAFEQYLLDSTVLERPSTTRHKYMKLYIENGEMYLKLNLQVRFK